MSRKSALSAAVGSNVEGVAAISGPGPVDRPAPARPKDPRHEGLVRKKDVAAIPVGMIEADPDQPRKEFDPGELEKLARSLKANGQLHAIRVWWSAPSGRYVVVVGERRLRAARVAGLESLDCVIYDSRPEERELRAIQAMENLLRAELKPVEQAAHMRVLMEVHGYTQQQLAEEVGFQQSAIAKALALLKLAPEVQADVDAGKISASAAYPISTLESPEEQKEVARKAVGSKLRRDQVAEEVKQVKERKSPGSGKGRGGAPKARSRTDAVFNAHPYRLSAVNPKGIEPASLRRALVQWADKIGAELEATA